MQDLRDRLAKTLVGVGDHQADASQPSLHELAQEGHPELMVFARTGRGSEHRALARCRDPDRDHGRHRDHPTGLANLVEGRVEPKVRALGLDRTAKERLHLLIE